MKWGPKLYDRLSMPPQILQVFVAALTSICIVSICPLIIGEQDDDDIYGIDLYLPFAVTVIVYQSLLLLVINAYLMAFRKLGQHVEGNGTFTDLDEFETLIDAYQSLNFGIGKDIFSF